MLLATVPEEVSYGKKTYKTAGTFAVASRVRRVFSQKGGERKRRDISKRERERVIGKDKGK